MSRKISYFSIASIYFFIFVAGIMCMVMDTAKDRDNYLRHFGEPFYDNRIEIGFQYYMQIFTFMNIPPTISIVITCVVIYFLLSRVWFYFIKIHWLLSILLFNFFAFGLMNYYIGTSIRMGLAIGLVLFSSIKIIEGSKKFWLFLFLSFFIHYGVILYILIFTFSYLVKKRGLIFHLVVSFIGFLSILILFDIILPYLGLSTYYLNYFNGSIYIGRPVPFTIIYFIIALFFIFFKFEDLKKNSPVFLLVFIYTLPFLFFWILTQTVLIPKMMIPVIFLASIFLSNLYISTIVKNFSANLLIPIFLMFNIFSLLYALKMYQFI